MQIRGGCRWRFSAVTILLAACVRWAPASAALSRDQTAEKSLKRAMEVEPSNVSACVALASHYNRPIWNGARFDDMISTLERCAARARRDPAAYFRIASFLWDKAYRDTTLAGDQRMAYVERGLAHADSALALKDDFIEAIIYKGLLLRLKARDVDQLVEQERLVDEARALQRRATELKKAGVRLHPDPYGGMLAPAMPPPPAPPAMPEALRVGGLIEEPKKIRNVAPQYPDAAKQARVQGVITLECTIGVDGTVIDIRVLRGIPLLDAAAIDAVRQWVYEPTLYNGMRVPVIMTVTVNFRLS